MAAVRVHASVHLTQNCASYAASRRNPGGNTVCSALFSRLRSFRGIGNGGLALSLGCDIAALEASNEDVESLRVGRGHGSDVVRGDGGRHVIGTKHEHAAPLHLL